MTKKERKTTLEFSSENIYKAESKDFHIEYNSNNYSNATSTMKTNDEYIIDFFTLPGTIADGVRTIPANRIMMNHKNAKKLAEQILNSLKDISEQEEESEDSE
ncbi:DUF3467 domain-containing protein [Methanoplanus endosymbiosus]|uniref:DUF3467 domain-containing protein n=1 Tax=Methanoplanus endosymbiosus TaxID=33865 RepID=A0A9E7TIW2_9EURY|nr:DUF3467 domain-containing protein [Methanoplanus endosymbiosus]UUX92983.1 DUF3467 domain-containing protein [Methanoplanus endosymbiosus]